MAQEIDYCYRQLETYNEEIVSLNEKLGYLAEHDPLTELTNRRMFKQELNQELEKGESGAVLLLIRLSDKFKIEIEITESILLEDDK